MTLCITIEEHGDAVKRKGMQNNLSKTLIGKNNGLGLGETKTAATG